MIFNDPIGWSRGAVGTWPRFVLTGAFVVALPLAIAYFASKYGWHSAIWIALFLGQFQLLLLYALRRAIIPKIGAV